MRFRWSPPQEATPDTAADYPPSDLPAGPPAPVVPPGSSQSPNPILDYLAGAVRNAPEDLRQNVRALLPSTLLGQAASAFTPGPTGLPRWAEVVGAIGNLATHPEQAAMAGQDVSRLLEEGTRGIRTKPLETVAGVAQRYPVSTLLALAPVVGKGLGRARLAAARGVGAGAEIAPAPGRVAAAVSRETPPPANRLEVPRIQGLPPDEAAVQESFAQAVEQHPDELVRAYRERFGNTINPDHVRELSPEYRVSAETRRRYATATHESSSTLAKEIYRQALQEEPGPGQNPSVLVVAGGTGSGKSTVAPELTSEVSPQITYDISFARHTSAKRVVDQALAAGKDITIGFVYRDPVEAYLSREGGVLTRGVHGGRTPPIAFHVGTHVEAPRTIVQLASEYAGNPKVQIRIFESGPHKTFSPMTLDQLAEKAHAVDPRGIYEAIERGTRERLASGEIPADVAQRALAFPFNPDLQRAPSAGGGTGAPIVTGRGAAPGAPGLAPEGGPAVPPEGGPAPVSSAEVSPFMRAQMAGEERVRLEGIWQRLMTRPDKDAIAGELTPPQAQQFLERLRAAPGNNPQAETALLKRATPEPVAPAPVPTPRAGQPTSRANQVHPANAELARQIESSPAYLERLKASGGGRVVTHEETLNRVLGQAPMTVEELERWPARKAANADDVVRAGVLRSNAWTEYQKALFEDNNPERAAQVEQILHRIEPGYHNLTGEPGRALEIQKVLQLNNDLWRKISDLRARNVPLERVKALIAADEEAIRKVASSQRADKFALDLVKRLEHYATVAKLTSPVTHAVNSISNSMTFLQRGLEHTVGGVAALPFDPALGESMLRNAWGGVQGFKDAWRAARESFWNEGGSKFQESRLKPLLPENVRKPFRIFSPYRWLSAADEFWKGAITHSYINSAAFEEATKQGLRGAARATKIKELVANPFPEWTQRAEQQAKEFTFQEDPDRALQAMTSLVDSIPFFRLVVPFLKTPYNLLRFQIRRTPLGAFAKSFREDLAAGGRRRAEAIGRLAVGTGLTGSALATAWNGDVTGALPTDPGERARWEAEGRKPWSIRTGKYWLAYNRFSPQGAYLAQVADVVQALKQGDEGRAERLYTAALATTLAQLKDQPYMQGLAAVSDVVDDPERWGDRFVQGSLTGFIPNILRDVRAQVDPAQRKPANLGEAIDYMIPGRSERVRQRVDVFGRPLGAAGSRLARATKVLSETHENEATKALEDAGWSPQVPNPQLKEKGRTLELKGEEATNFQTEMGQATLAAVLSVRRLPGWDGASMDQRKDRLTREVSRARTRVLEKWKSRYRVQLAQGGAK